MYDECETCGKGELKREYTFGMSDATVCTFTCGHACCSDDWGDTTWHATYADAAGQARLLTHKGRCDDRVFMGAK